MASGSSNNNSVFRGLQTHTSSSGSINNSGNNIVTSSFAVPYPPTSINIFEHNSQNQNTLSNNQHQPQQQQYTASQSLSGHHVNTTRSPPQSTPQATISSNFASLVGRSGIGGPSTSSRQIPTSVSSAQSPDHMTTIMAKLWFDHNVESSSSALKKEEHEKRMNDLRKQLEYISDTNWKYPSVEKYIAQI